MFVRSRHCINIREEKSTLAGVRGWVTT